MSANHSLYDKPAVSGPIGVFDSGVGGLTVLKHLCAQMPHETMVYVADSKFAPYGQRSALEIVSRTRSITQFLLDQGAKAIVMACNTATAAAAQTLRMEFDVPIIGMEPAVKPAVAVTQTGVIGVLATSGTLKSAQFAALLEHYSHGVTVVTQAGIGLVECIEQGQANSADARALLSTYLLPILQANADTLVLGCTHYPFLSALIEALIPELQARHQLPRHAITIIDTGRAVAQHAERRLGELHLLSKHSRQGEVRFWSSDNPLHASHVISQLWGQECTVSPLPTPDALEAPP